MKCKTSVTFLAALVMISGISFAYAGPSITGFSADTAAISRMGNFTVTVTGHGSKSPAPPAVWADFEGGDLNPSNLGQNTAWYATNNIALISTMTSYDGSGHAAGRDWSNCGGSGIFEIDLEGIGTNSSTFTLYVDRYFSYQVNPGGVVNRKLFRINPLGNDFVASTLSGGTCINEAHNTMNHTGVIPVNSPGVSHETWEWTQGDFNAGNNSNGTIHFESRSDHGDVVRDFSDYSNPTQLSQLVVDNLASGGTDCPGSTNTVTMDNYYGDTTFSAVFITTTATWGTSTHKWPQIIATWTGSNVTGRFNYPASQAAVTMYGYVRDAQNNVNASGFQITTSGGGGSTTPPTGGISGPGIISGGIFRVGN